MTFKGKLVDDAVMMDRQAIEELHTESFYGRIKGEALLLSLAESAYLMYMEKITVESKGAKLDLKEFFLISSCLIRNFELLYIVYKDLRERGYYVQPSVTGFRVYPRGGHPGKTPAEFFILVTSERIPLPVSDLKKSLGTVENLKKRLILAIVDEESDITFYEVKKTIPSGNHIFITDKISKASLLEERCIVWDPEASNLLHNEGFFGKPMDEGHLQLSLVESCYLLNKGILEIENREHEKLGIDQFSKIASKIETDFMIKYVVYEKLRNSGLVPKTGFKFGTHYRVYKNFEKMTHLQHSDYLIHAIDKDHVFSLQRLSRAVRLANSVKKEMIYAVVDSAIDFFIIGRMRL